MPAYWFSLCTSQDLDLPPMERLVVAANSKSYIFFDESLTESTVLYQVCFGHSTGHSGSANRIRGSLVLL